ncbi:GNAT family N-acetyltransferase [Devosia sp.]|uniref:GNAT family N-acetyltransferase n=1 Tax=Devosia sp. TaxID=1871048 RepID=UPI00292E9F48|nr:GNAT family N-acetyltransferase [Devosia sp.]
MIATEQPDVSLQWLHEGHAGSLHRLLQENRTHLTEHGDYREQVSTSLDVIRSELSAANGLRFGILVRDALVGRIDLVPVEPPQFGLGYWLAKNATGQGYATAAVRALVAYAATELGASDIYAGVTHGNARSEALLRRTGFVAVARFDTYTRFHRSLAASSIQD